MSKPRYVIWIRCTQTGRERTWKAAGIKQLAIVLKMIERMDEGDIDACWVRPAW